ncbi:hypothetical protein [Methylophaga sulfidovorans]|uniref:Uncharacterized protein n=1 Tax=Methylophaga sulfidovorans TaxID=45496 RepID=A0A1I4A2Y0_9GAMM|nr:hypothetical protein [Methylophaga sulfidovorans]SFK50457.1 hypothetical protein SAMN04488079_1134 [Methylophaga sulfidovorans]
MRYTAILAPLIVIAVIVLNQTFAKEKESHSAMNLSAPAEKLAESCYQHWLTLNWKLANTEMLASNNKSFRDGIKKVCQARAELFFEGYEIQPFISAGAQHEIFPLVFRPNVEDIKAQIRINLPQLRLI